MSADAPAAIDPELVKGLVADSEWEAGFDQVTGAGGATERALHAAIEGRPPENVQLF